MAQQLYVTTVPLGKILARVPLNCEVSIRTIPIQTARAWAQSGSFVFHSRKVRNPERNEVARILGLPINKLPKSVVPDRQLQYGDEWVIISLQEEDDAICVWVEIRMPV